MNLINLLFAGGVSAALVLDTQTPTQGAGWNFFGDFATGKDVIRLGKGQNSQAAIGASFPIDFDEWTLDTMLYMLSDSPDSDPGTSGLTLWYTASALKEGPVHGGMDFWDGLAIMIDSLGWDETGREKTELGAVRGHFNDGSQQFKAGVPAKQAFSLCQVPYRRARGPQRLRIGYGRGVFIVEVNDQKCFLSDSIVLPRGYVGVSADTSVTQDTFGVGRLEVREGFDDDLASYFPESRIEPKGGLARAAAGGNAAQAPGKASSDTGASSQSPVGANADANSDLAAAAAAAGQANLHYRELLDSVSKLANRFDSIETLVAAQAALNSAGTSNVENTEKLLGASVSQVGDRVTDKIRVLLERADRTDRLIQQLQTSIDNLKDGGLLSDVRSMREELSGMSRMQTATLDATRAGLPVWQIIGVSAAVQVAVYIAFAVIRRRRNLRQKLL